MHLVTRHRNQGLVCVFDESTALPLPGPRWSTMESEQLIKDHHFMTPLVEETHEPYTTKPGRIGNGHVASEIATGEDW